MATHRIEIPWQIGKGQIIKKTPTLAMGDVVEFFWHTTSDTDPDLVKQNGNFACDSLPGNNCEFRGEIKGPGFPTGAEGGAIKTGSGQSSFSWAFKKDFAVQPDADYTVTITISQDGSPGLNGKLNAGPSH